MPFKKILLVMPSGRHGLGFMSDFIPIGLEYLASTILDSGFEVRIADLKMENRPVDAIFGSYRPDLVGISMCATEHTEGLEIAGKAKARGITTVVGNYHPTGLPDLFAAHPDVDYVVRGEGEETFLELIRRGDGRGIAGLSYAENGIVVHAPDRPLIHDLDALPFPARRLRRSTYFRRAGRKTECDVLTFTRGCGGRCAFCCEPFMNRCAPRARSAENILREVEAVRAFHGRRPLSIGVTDPDALVFPALMDEVCEDLIPLRHGIEFSCHVRPDAVVAHPETVRRMVRAGFVSFEMGIESPRESDLVSTRKGVSAEIHREACRILGERGGRPLGTFVIGLPAHTPEIVADFPAYGRSIGLTGAAFGIATPFPGTAFFEDLSRRGLIFESDWTKFDEMHSVFHAAGLPDKSIEKLASACYSRFWSIAVFLDAARIDLRRTGRRKSLAEFVRDLLGAVEFARGALDQVQNHQALEHVLEFLMSAPDGEDGGSNPVPRMHDVIDMDRFLKILGDQTLEITILHRKRPLTSWILDFQGREVRGIRVVRGEDPSATLHFKLDLADIGSDLRISRTRRLRLAASVLNSNRGWARRGRLVRLILAAVLGGFPRSRNGGQERPV
jgi:radical SAM superfamily enzyme YgiQ (UPF0313 family)